MIRVVRTGHILRKRLLNRAPHLRIWTDWLADLLLFVCVCLLFCGRACVCECTRTVQLDNLVLLLETWHRQQRLQ